MIPPSAPGAKPYARRRKRLLDGSERLAINSFSVHDAMARAPSNRQCVMAGEQFNGYMMGIAVIVMLAVFEY